jgi:hypothetical protein
MFRTSRIYICVKEERKNIKQKISVTHSGPILMAIIFPDDGIVYTVHIVFRCFEDTPACIFETKTVTIPKTSGYNAVQSLKVNLAELSTCFKLVSCLAYSSVLNMEVTGSPETSFDFQQTTWRYTYHRI